MSKIELSLATNYVASWSIADAIRELFQNALDQEAVSKNNTASWHYDRDARTIQICNKKSTLTMQSLLLGSTTKEDDTRTIGQFGEGYKIATLVLLRNNKKVVIYNYGAKEVWRPRMVKSRRFGTEILTFFIEKQQVWDRIPDQDLTIVVQDISNDEWDNDIVPTNLYLQPGYEVVHATPYGEIIRQPGMVFVNGLLVCKYEPYKYGYNFAPGQLRLDRDRKLASDFDLKWLASKMWTKCPDVLSLIESGAPDVAYISDISWLVSTELFDSAFERFRKIHGAHAVPVVLQEDLARVPAGYKGVIVPSNFNNLIRRSSLYQDPPPDAVELSTRDRLWAWYMDNKDSIPSSEQDRFETIYNALCDE